MYQGDILVSMFLSHSIPSWPRKACTRPWRMRSSSFSALRTRRVRRREPSAEPLAKHLLPDGKRQSRGEVDRYLLRKSDWILGQDLRLPDPFCPESAIFCPLFLFCFVFFCLWFFHSSLHCSWHVLPWGSVSMFSRGPNKNRTSCFCKKDRPKVYQSCRTSRRIQMAPRIVSSQSSAARTEAPQD